VTKYQQGGGAKCPRDETTGESIKEIISVYLVRKKQKLIKAETKV